MSEHIQDIRKQSSKDCDGTDQALNQTSLANSFRGDIIDGLSRPYGEKMLPQTLLYDQTGLKMWEEVTRQPEYYLTRIETALLQKYCDEIASTIPNGSVLVDLGSG